MRSILENYIKVAFRNIKSQKVYTFINISGLSIGIVSCILIILFVEDEIGYDKFHKNADRIYRVTETRYFTDVPRHFATSYIPISKLLNKDYPQIKTVRFSKFEGSVSHGAANLFDEKNFLYADSSIFDVFDFKLLLGNPKTALAAPFSIVITTKMAKKYFGDKNPIGKMLMVDSRLPFKVTGIVAQPPLNSHIKFDFLASFSTISSILGKAAMSREAWWAPQIYTYMLFPEKYDIEGFKAHFTTYVNEHIKEWMQDKRHFKLQALTKIHLHSRLEGELEANSSMAMIYIFSAVAIFILLIACLNFMNLSTAKSAKRAKEVAVRKIVGVKRRELIVQFLSESLIFSFLSLLLAFALIEILLPWFNTLTGKELSITKFNGFALVLFFFFFAFVVGLLSGAYPALHLSNTKAIDFFKGKTMQKKGNVAARKFLVIIEFAISTFLICFTLLVSKQLDFMQNANLGFDKEQIIVIPIKDKEVKNDFAALKKLFLSNKNIKGVTISCGVPGKPNNSEFPYKIEGMKIDDSFPNILTFPVDYNFIDIYGLQLIEGRNFVQNDTDKNKAFILNETAVKTFGWKNPIGKKFTLVEFNGKKLETKDGEIIGVIKDFHYRSLHYNIEPLVMEIAPANIFYNSISLKINTENVKKTLHFIQQAWNKVSPKKPFDFFFLNKTLDRQYKAEEKMSSLVNAFSLLAVFIACLGLFGLSSFLVEQRTKEIGLRKVLGSSVSEIVVLLSTEFSKWVLIANVLACPVAWFAMDKWLENFAYRTNIGILIFVTATTISFTIAILSVSFQAVSAANANPVESLLYE
ncbi:MAG: ABC transporter permease [Bacteroidia bacterium]|nr:MAG: ABC transporter permease [Bacteroidia bacterium]